jgi:hypothetical protein
MGTGNSGFIRGNCELQNCFTSASKYEWEKSDALVFHGEDLRGPQIIYELEKLSNRKKQMIESGQKTPLFIYFMKEPPHNGNKLKHSIFEVIFIANVFLKDARMFSQLIT